MIDWGRERGREEEEDRGQWKDGLKEITSVTYLCSNQEVPVSRYKGRAQGIP